MNNKIWKLRSVFKNVEVQSMWLLRCLFEDLLECPLAKQAWEAFYFVWHQWGVPNDVILSWPFVMLGEAIFEREADFPRFKGTM